MQKSSIRTVRIFRRPGHTKALEWERRIIAWLRKHQPSVRVTQGAADLLIALGGDGTIIEAARRLAPESSRVLGLNLGTVGFLASVRAPSQFLRALRLVFAGKFRTVPRMMLSVTVTRTHSVVFESPCMNEVFIQHPFGTVAIDVLIGATRVQSIRGTGVIAATPTGSTGYNLSAHGPIVDPELQCVIITEVLDHNVPTPSMVIPSDKHIHFRIKDFRKRNTIHIAGTHELHDVILAIDGQALFPLEKSDTITVTNSGHSYSLVELESSYFYTSLHEKFSLT